MADCNRRLRWDGKKLSIHRRGCGLTQRQLAAVIGRSRESVQAYEATRAVPPVTVAVAIATALGVDLAELVGPGGERL